MNARFVGIALVSALGLVCSHGCKHCRRDCCPPCPPQGTSAAFAPSPALGLLPAHPLTPMQPSPSPNPICPGGNCQPAAPMAPPAPPVGGAIPQPPYQGAIPYSPPPSNPPPAPGLRAYPPSGAQPGGDSWKPAPDAVPYTPPRTPSLEPPAAPPSLGTPEPPRDGVRLYPPETTQPPQAQPPQAQPPQAQSPQAQPPQAQLSPPAFGEQPGRTQPAPDSAPTPSLPVGIPQFASARDQVATGLRPSLEGLDWLQANNYRTVLNIHAPGEDDAADRAQVEKRGMKYLSLEVAPETLSRRVVDEFNRVVSDRTNSPLFVYDRDGMLAGGLWYLHFRTAEQTGDEVARMRAARLGLREGQNGEHRAMWLAIQKFLSDNPQP